MPARAGPSGGPAPSVSVSLDFAGDPAAVLLVAEAHRLAHGHQFNAAFASETARIDPLPHQRIAVYERMLKQEPLRFLLADDAGAGLSWAARHLLLLTATPTWARSRPGSTSGGSSTTMPSEPRRHLRRYPPGERQRYFIRRTKEEMVDLEGNPLYRQRECSTFSFQTVNGPSGPINDC